MKDGGGLVYDSRQKRKMINKKHHDVSSNKDCLKILRETSKNFFNILWKCKWIAEEFRLAKAYRIFLLDLVSLFAFLSLDIPSPPRFPTSLDFYTFLCRFAITILTSLQKPRNIYRRKNARKYANSVRSERKKWKFYNRMRFQDSEETEMEFWRRKKISLHNIQ